MPLRNLAPGGSMLVRNFYAEGSKLVRSHTERFGSVEDTRAHCDPFFGWYNDEHHHHGLGLLTPRDVHYGLAEQRVAARNLVLASAFRDHPERFPAAQPTAVAAPIEVWINKPTTNLGAYSPQTPSGSDPARAHSARASSELFKEGSSRA